MRRYFRARVRKPCTRAAFASDFSSTVLQKRHTSSVVFGSKGADREGRRGRRWEGRDPCQPWLGINVLQGAEKVPEEGRDLIRGPWRPCKQTERGAMAVRIAA
jgi:hypothetical protein